MPHKAAALAAIEDAANRRFPGRVALVSSFGTESAVLLHMAARLDRALPILFIDTGRLFGETLAYRDALARLEARRVDAARRACDAHLRAHPRGAYAARASWWRAECLYALRAYTEALAAYRSFASVHGAHARAPEALLRASLCLVRMGRQSEARELRTELQRRYPDSLAARSARRAGAS